MASTGLDFSQLTPPNGAIRDMGQIIMTNVLAPERLGALFNILTNVHNGDKIGVVGEFGLVGLANAACAPDYRTDPIATSEVTMCMSDWEVAQKICYRDLEGTFVQYMLRTKTSIADLTANDYLDEIIRPRLELAIRKMLFRLAWFGGYDKTMVLEDYEDYFADFCDGLHKTLLTAAATNGSANAANSESTLNDMRAAMMTAGAATGALDELIWEAKPELRSAANQVIYMSMAFADALAHDVQVNNVGSELQWNSWWDGIKETTYQGVRVMALPLLDEIITTYMYDSTNSVPVSPYFAVYTTKDNILLGVGGNNDIEDLQVWFDRTDQMNYLLARDKVGAAVADMNMVRFSY